MRITSILLVGIVSASLHASPLIQYQVSSVGTTCTGQTLFRYNYLISGCTLFQNEEIDIRFDSDVFGQLLNGLASPGFDLLLFQPNQRPGAFVVLSPLSDVSAYHAGTLCG